ncbi:MAG: flagellar hook-basal body complex protein FliE [Candidatus Zixiibacteriota bacterium]
MGNVISPAQRLVPALVERAGAEAVVVKNSGGPDQPKFSDMVGDLLESVNQLQNESAEIQRAFLAGEEVELHQMMIKAEEAGISMDLLLEIRNRLVDGYNEIMKMPL